MEFTALFPDSAHAKVLETLLVEPSGEFTVSDASRRARVSRPTVYKVLGYYSRLGLVTPTRRVGNAQLYRLTPDHAEIEGLEAALGTRRTGVRRRTGVVR